MENYLLYEDDEIRVEIDGLFHKILSTKIRVNDLDSYPEATVEKLLKYISTLFPEENCLNVSSSVPILEPDALMIISKPFDMFETGINYIVSIPNFKENIESIVDDLNNHYSYGFLREDNDDDSLIECHLFEEKIDGISGYFLNLKGKDAYVMFFGYE